MTARTMSRSFGKRKNPFLATFRLPTQTVNSPVFPGTRSTSTPSSLFNVSAARAALGLYDAQTRQYRMTTFSWATAFSMDDLPCLKCA